MENADREEIGKAVHYTAENIILEIEQSIIQENSGLGFDDTPHRVTVAELLFTDFFPV